MQAYLVNILIFCGILLVIALIVGSIQLILILFDVRKMTREIKDKVVSITGSLLSAVALGIKKGIEILLKK
jgi:hypothetical protein